MSPDGTRADDSGAIWITGARGFIGRRLTRRLRDLGRPVAGVGHGGSPPELSQHTGVAHWIDGDVDGSNLQQLLSRTGPPETIYHLAGGSLVGASFASPAEDFRRSVGSTASLLEWVRIHTPSAAVVLSSSAAVYGSGHSGPIDEAVFPAPYSPYGFHKRASELLCESYAHNFGLRISVVRLFSVYGPGLRKQLLWDLCWKLTRAAGGVILHGTGDEIRDWIYVDDAVRILTAAAGAASEVPFTVNGGSGVGTPVRSIAASVAAAWEGDVAITFSGHQRPGDPFSMVAGTDRLKLLGFAPSVGMVEGLTRYVEWFRAEHSSLSP